MAETAAFLVDEVLPHVRIRQWVLSLPIALRYKLAYDSALASAVLQLFIRAVFASLRRRARHRFGRGRYDGGAVTFVQRFGDALNLNLHYHTLALDGVYWTDDSGRRRFHHLPPPTDEEVERVTRAIVRRLRRLLLRRGITADADPTDIDALPGDEPVLAEIYAASVRSRIALGERAGRPVLRAGMLVDPEEQAFVSGPRCTAIDGVSLHANVFVPAGDRRRLEKLCRYIARPPVATGRLSRLEDGRLLYRLKRRWRDGTTHVIFEPLELVEKLAAIVPPPRVHMIRYHGVLAPRAKQRRMIVGPRDEYDGTAENRPRTSIAVTANEERHATCTPTASSRGSRHRWIPWAELMQRVFAVDVLECPSCHGQMKIIAIVQPPADTREVLESMGLASRAPPLEPPSVPEGDAEQPW